MENKRTIMALPKWIWMTASILVTFSLAILSGCVGTSVQPRFYILSTLSTFSTNQGSAEATQAVSRGDLVIGIGPVILPAYLKRHQIVTRIDSNRLMLNEFHRWAEPLEEGIPRLLREYMSSCEPVSQIVSYPWSKSIKLDYQVRIEILRMDGVLGGNVVLDARWTILDHTKKVLFSQKALFSDQTEDSGFSAYVVAQSRLVAELSDKICSSLKGAEKIN